MKKYHVVFCVSVGSSTECYYCITESDLNKDDLHEEIGKMLLDNKFIYANSDPDRVNDGKKTSYLIKTDRIYCVNVSEK